MNRWGNPDRRRPVKEKDIEILLSIGREKAIRLLMSNTLCRQTAKNVLDGKGCTTATKWRAEDAKKRILELGDRSCHLLV